MAGSHTQVPASQRWPEPHCALAPQRHTPLVLQVSARRGAQLTQATPERPHVAMDEVRHTSPSQHPFAQFPTLQSAVVTHRPAMQLAPAPHETQTPPSDPHELFVVPTRQVPAWQHPAQLPAPQGFTHCLLVHVVVQVAHATPPVPQALGSVPGWQTPATQQPAGHVCALQVPTQAPPSQVPWPHCSQALPSEPQAPFVGTVTQLEPMQQPLAHEIALHVDIAHWPPVHAEPPQSRHARPFEPQLLDEGVVMHWLPWQHPDGHDDGVH